MMPKPLNWCAVHLGIATPHYLEKQAAPFKNDQQSQEASRMLVDGKLKSKVSKRSAGVADMVRRLSLPIASWPGPHRKAMELATRKGGSSKYARAANWRTDSVRGPIRAWGQWLTYRTSIGLQIDCDPAGNRSHR